MQLGHSWTLINSGDFVEHALSGETNKAVTGEGGRKNIEKSKTRKRANKALLEVIPQPICSTFRHTTFWSRPKITKSRLWGQEMPGQEATTSFLTKSTIMKISRPCICIQHFGLRMKDSESLRCHRSNGTPPNLQNYRIKFNVGQNINGPLRPKCILDYSVNRSQ